MKIDFNFLNNLKEKQKKIHTLVVSKQYFNTVKLLYENNLIRSFFLNKKALNLIFVLLKKNFNFILFKKNYFKSYVTKYKIKNNLNCFEHYYLNSKKGVFSNIKIYSLGLGGFYLLKIL